MSEGSTPKTRELKNKAPQGYLWVKSLKISRVSTLV